MSAVLTFPDGFKAVISAATDRSSINLWECSGEAGSVGILRFDPQGVSDKKSGTVLICTDEDSNADIVSFDDNFDPMDQFKFEFQNFADSILGKSAPFISSEEIIFKTRILEQIMTVITPTE